MKDIGPGVGVDLHSKILDAPTGLRIEMFISFISHI